MSPEEKLLRAIFASRPIAKKVQRRVIDPKSQVTMEEKAGERHDPRTNTRH